MGFKFDRATIEHAFMEMGGRALADGKLVEISVYGGSAITLIFDTRRATKDVDAVFERDRDWIRRTAKDMADANGWDPDWLNDGVKGFLTTKADEADWLQLFRAYPSEEKTGLRVMIPRPEYIFAMKCMAMRIGGVEESQDIEDIRMLVAPIGLKSAEAAMELVQVFYPQQRIPPKTQFGLEEIFSRLFDERGDPGRDGEGGP